MRLNTLLFRPAMPKRTVIIVTTILLAYFVFTSGAVYELTGSTVTDRMVVPYSLALSGERTGLVGLFNDDDQKVATWIAAQSDKDIPVVCDGNVGLLLRGYEFARIEQITYFTGLFRDSPHYLAFSTWNTESGKIVVGATSAGMRNMDRMPDIDAKSYREVFRSGKSVIYEYVHP